MKLSGSRGALQYGGFPPTNVPGFSHDFHQLGVVAFDPTRWRGAAAPAPHKIAEQIAVQALQTQMVVRYMRGEALEKTLTWAEGELEGFMRN